MTRSRILPLILMLSLTGSLEIRPEGRPAGPDPEEQWGQWRGPLSTGVAPHGNPPIRWDEATNIRWKVEIPGQGQSTPIVWGDRIFLTTAVPHGEAAKGPGSHSEGAHDNVAPLRKMRFVVLALDRADGSIAWQKVMRDERPHQGVHATGSWASASAVTDGEVLIASFGSRGIYGLTLEGEKLWEVELGDMEVFHGHGEGSSPALHRGTVVVNWDHQGDSFVVALDSRTGKERWRAARDEITSWSSPLVVQHDGKAQVVVAATGRVRSYDLATGKVIWELGGLSRNVVATPVAGNGMVFVANSYDWRAMIAVRLSAAKGDITNTEAVVWTRDRDTPYVPSPLLYDDTLCFVKHLQGVFTCVDAATGATRYGPARLPGIRSVFASPAGAAGRIYIPSRDGVTQVMRNGDGFEVLASNRLEESFSASPAIVGDELFLRGERHLYSIAAPPLTPDAAD